MDTLRHPQVIKDSPRSNAGIARKVAVERDQRAVKVEQAGLLEDPCRRELRGNGIPAGWVDRSVGPTRERGQLQVVAVAGDDVKRSSGTEFDQRGKSPIAKEFAGKTVAGALSGLVHAADDEPAPLIEQRS